MCPTSDSTKHPVSRPVLCALGVAWLVLSLNLACAVGRFQPNVLTWDQWDFFAPLFAGRNWWALFHYQHGPHRQGLGFVLTSLVAKASRWDTRWDSLWIASLLSFSALLALRLKWKLTGTLGFADVWIPIVGLTLGQFEAILLTPNASHSAFPLALTLLLSLFWLSANPWTRYLAAGPGAVCLTFTGFGLFAGAMFFLLLLAAGVRHLIDREHRSAIPAGVGLAIATIGWIVFCSDYVFAPAVPNFRFPWRPVSDYFRFISLMLLAPTGASPGTGGFRYFFGGLVLVTLLVSAVFIGWRWLTLRKQSLTHDVMVLLVGSGLLFVCNAAVGRISLGITAGMASRYVTLMFPLWLAVYFAGIMSGRRAVAIGTGIGLWIIALLPYRDMAQRPWCRWPGTFGVTTEQYQYFDRFTTGKAAWVDAYLRTGSVEKAQAAAGPFVYPTPSATNMDDKLAYLRSHRLSFFSGGSFLPWLLHTKVIWDDQFPSATGSHLLGRDNRLTFITDRNCFLEIPLSAATAGSPGIVGLNLDFGHGREIVKLSYLPAVLSLPVKSGFNRITLIRSDDYARQGTVMAGPVSSSAVPPKDAVVLGKPGNPVYVANPPARPQPLATCLRPAILGALAVVALLLAAFWRWRPLRSEPAPRLVSHQNSATAVHAGSRKSARWFLIGGLLLLIFGAKLRLIQTAGSDLPTWDQWDSEGDITFRPWLEGHLHAEDIFRPHTEHRIVTTKLFTLGLLAANGEWDNFVETTANAVIHTLVALALILLACRWLRGVWLGAFGGLVLLLFSLPFSSDNTLVGFQAQFYFLIGFAVLHIWLTLDSDRFSWRWGLGQLCGLLGLVSMATGFFSGIAIAAVLALRLLRERRWTPQQIATATIAAVLTILGWLLRTRVPAHDFLQSHSIGQFCRSFLQLAAWPGSAFFPWSLALMLPAWIFAIRSVLRKKFPADDAILLALFGWVLLQFVATAYARGLLVLTSRYFDIAAIGIVIGFIAIVREFTGRSRRLLAAVWLAAICLGLVQESRRQWHENIAPGIIQKRQCEENVHDYLQTGDPGHLLNKPFGDIPYPSGSALIARLAPISIRRVLPPSVRLPVPILAGAPATPDQLPPQVPRGQFGRAVSTWSGPANGRSFFWRSAVQPSTTLPVLRFRIAGDLGTPGRTLRLVVKSAAGAVPVRPDSASGLHWKTVNVFRPPGSWWIEATDTDPAAWFAFTEPVEVGRLSWLAGKLLKHHLFFIILGGIFSVAGIWLSRGSSISADSGTCTVVNPTP